MSDLLTTVATLANATYAREAFGELVRRYQDAAFGTAYAILRDPAAAEDATQAAFLTAWIHKNDLRHPQAFGGWLRTIVRTECSRILRRNRLMLVPLDDVPPIAAKPTLDSLSNAELRAVLLEAIATLPEPAQTAIVLRYMSDFSYQEMAEFLEVPVSTVKKRLHDARKRLLTWFNRAADARAHSVLSEYRPSRDLRLKNRVMTATAFLDTIISGDVSAVAAALQEQPQLCQAEGERRPLFGFMNAMWVAIMWNRADVVKLLIASGAPLHARNSVDVSPLAAAAVEGRPEVVKILLDAGATVDIFAACALGDTKRVAALLSEQPALARARHADGKTVLHFCRSVAVAELLLATAAHTDLDAIDDGGSTPLQWIAATGRYKDVCRYLIARGAKAEAVDIFSACSYGDLAAVSRLLRGDPLLIAARLPAGPGVPRVAIGSTPLHLASIRGEEEIALLLIKHGADVNAHGGETQITPLHGAAAGGHFEVAKMLLTAGADVTARDSIVGGTPEGWARHWGHAELADFLKSVAP